MSEMQKRAVLYLRVSTESQTGRDGDSEGYSIPAQREAGTRKAEELRAKVVAEFSDPGVTGRSDRRPGLQALLERIRTKGDIDLVIVWKLSRMSRSPLIDENLELEFLAYGVRLVSCTENIDVTPSGRLLRRILGTINAYEIDNLAQNVSAGIARKVQTGGTASKAPIGYINVRKVVDGAETRTVEVDPERAPHVRWMFEAYATGEYTITQLLRDVTRRGLDNRATRKLAARPLSRASVQRILTNPYYTGTVVYKGAEYPGRHEPLITQELFQRVQDELIAARCGQKTQQHQHYLKGSIFCARCKSRLSITFAKGNGGIYPYFFCLGRQRGGKCDQPCLPVDQVEAEMMRFYSTQTVDADLAQRIRVRLHAQLRKERKHAKAEVVRQTKQLERLKRQRLKLLEAHYDDLIDPELFASEQRRITQEVLEAERTISEGQREWNEIEAGLDDLFALVTRWGDLFEKAGDQLRRRINQALWERIEVDGEKDIVAKVQDAPPDRLSRRYVESILEEISATEAAEASAAFETTNPPLVSVGTGSNIVSLVREGGLEPPRPKTPAPKAGASANSATLAAARC